MTPSPSIHPLLARQLKKHASFTADGVPPEWRGLCEAVSEAYANYEEDYRLVERTLELSSSELNSTNQLIEQQKKELERSNTELEHFAYIASHDLQEPLRTVQSYLQLLRRRYHSIFDQDAEEFIDFAIDGATRMRDLIDDLLTYARVASRAKPLLPTSVDDVVDEVMHSLQVRLKEKQAVVERGSLPTVMADRRQLAQLIQNLISNSLKFQKQGDVPRIQISATNQNGHWIMRVQDNGIGMDPAYQDKIFVIFQRLHTREDFEGTGVGLAVCKKIIDRHGGTIWVESQPGEGSTFLFTLADASGTPTEMRQPKVEEIVS